jgi:hypothetical protein
MHLAFANDFKMGRLDAYKSFAMLAAGFKLFGGKQKPPPFPEGLFYL